MVGARYVYGQQGHDWLGYFEEFPDYITQGETLEDLREHLADLLSRLDERRDPRHPARGGIAASRVKRTDLIRKLRVVRLRISPTRRKARRVSEPPHWRFTTKCPGIAKSTNCLRNRF
jgi:hypothetical protein